ncbi:lysoplasmalogenase [Acidovorax sp. YS12]|nr:lysoplasmalogenase [Acidovorax sp. YS12]
MLPPPPPSAPRGFVAVQAVLLLAGATAWALQAGQAPWAANALWLAVLLACATALAAVRHGRLGCWAALMVQCAALATATSALELTAWHWLFKPLAMLCAIVWVAASAHPARAGATFFSPSTPALDATGRRWLTGALAASLAGDAFLMVEGFFVPGLASFLLAHLAYIAVLRRGQRWFAHRGALAATLAIGLGMYLFLWHGGLPPALRLPVAVYVTVIALMAAQALGRAHQLRTRGATLVALGACSFLCSDAVLATNRFVQPLPWAALWVLASYYLAQGLIVAGLLRPAARPGT